MEPLVRQRNVGVLSECRDEVGRFGIEFVQRLQYGGLFWRTICVPPWLFVTWLRLLGVVHRLEPTWDDV